MTALSISLSHRPSKEARVCGVGMATPGDRIALLLFLLFVGVLGTGLGGQSEPDDEDASGKNRFSTELVSSSEYDAGMMSRMRGELVGGSGASIPVSILPLLLVALSFFFLGGL